MAQLSHFPTTEGYFTSVCRNSQMQPPKLCPYTKAVLSFPD
jgi:hypothetical protein